MIKNQNHNELLSQHQIAQIPNITLSSVCIYKLCDLLSPIIVLNKVVSNCIGRVVKVLKTNKPIFHDTKVKKTAFWAVLRSRDIL